MLEVLPALGAHHKVVLECNGETLSDRVPGIAGLGLGESPRSALIRNAGAQALVEGPTETTKNSQYSGNIQRAFNEDLSIKKIPIPLDFLVDIFNVHVRENHGRERGRGRVGDKPINLVRDPRVGTPQGIRQVPARVAFIPLKVQLHVSNLL